MTHDNDTKKECLGSANDSSRPVYPRLLIALNVMGSVVLAFIFVVLVFFLSRRHFYHWNISSSDYYRLSDKTITLLHEFKGELYVYAFLRKSFEAYDEIRNLLMEYRYEAEKCPNMRLILEFVDVDRDIPRVQELLRQFEVTEPNTIIFESKGRRKYVGGKDVLEHKYWFEGNRINKERVAFNGEQAFSSAILSVMQSSRPIVYFLAGHGERAPDDFDRNTGYSSIAKILRNDNMEVRPLILGKGGKIPDDCTVLVIAGPDKKLSTFEVEYIKLFLLQGGRLCVMLDPVVATGLEDLLTTWGISLDRDVVVDPMQTFSGNEIVVSEYGDHPITRKLRNTAIMFYKPRSIWPISEEKVNLADGSTSAFDRPKITPLALTSRNAWCEKNLNESPSKFNENEDKIGPVPIALAVERGNVSGTEVEIRPTRMVVIGDSSFISNSALAQGMGGGVDFFVNCINWLADRDSLMAIAAKPPNIIRLEMPPFQLKLMWFFVVVPLPLVFGIVGLMVWIFRRK